MTSLLARVILGALLAATGGAETLKYSPQELEGLVQSGKAIRTGACFANQGNGCETYAWVDTNEHHLFVFLRNGRSLGEFRDERLANGAFLEIIQNYVQASALGRDASPVGDEIPLIDRDETVYRTDGIWTSSLVHWRLLWTETNYG